jgi:hypothetical protein
MEGQHYKNHSRIAPRAYYTGILLALAVLILAISYSCNLAGGWHGLLLPLLFAFISLGMILIGHYARAFALKAQDRAIRAEENLRYFVLTGKLLDKKLKISQVIALRFAADEEFVDLVKRAVEENLSNKQIKEAIKNWRGDYYRV